MSLKTLLKRKISAILGSTGYEIRRVAPGANQMWLSCRSLVRSAKPLIVDAGANAGHTAMEILTQFSNAEVACFEPDPDTFKVLEARLKGQARASAFCMALGDHPGAATFHRHQAHYVNSLLPSAPSDDALPWKEMMQEQATITVRVETLDAWAAAHGHESIAILKTDCQGFDLHVLRGASGLFNIGAIDIVVVEVLFVSLYAGQAFFDDVLGWLRERGFSLVGLYDVARTPGGAMAWADAVFVRKELLPANL